MRRAMAMLAVMGTIPAVVWAQDVVFPGSTVQGDILRGEGYFLKGLGWYELNSARARNIDMQTMILWNQALKNAYDQNAHERYVRLKKKKDTRAEVEADYQRRLRENPNADDIASGAALNALLSDLIVASYGDSAAWRNARLDLPEGITIPALSFQFVPMKNVGDNARLRESLICLSKLNAEGNWPVSLRDDAIRPEQQAYVQAILAVFDKCQKRKLDPSAIDELQRSIKSLKDKTATVVKAGGGHRAKAIAFLADMEKAQKMFDAQTVDFAEELISDIQQHKAQTVEELIGFMRKYRLRFAEADDENAPLYSDLYALLREQKEKLGIKAEPRPVIAGRVDTFQPHTVWISPPSPPNGLVSKLTVLERNSGQFKASFEVGPGITRLVTGTVRNNKILWYGKDVVALKGKPGGDNYGIINGDEISFEWFADGQLRGTFLLRLMKDY